MVTYIESSLPAEDRKDIERAFYDLIEKYSHDFSLLEKPLHTLVKQHGGFVHQHFFNHFFSLNLTMLNAGKLWDECLAFYKTHDHLDYRAAFLQYLLQNKHVFQPIVLEQEKRSHLLASTYTDALTGIYNHRYFNSFLMKELSRSKRSSLPLSLLLLDIDYFKRINDKYGHLSGDYILKEIGRVISISVRGTDMPCRYGGEEFAIVLPDTDTRGALVLAKRIQKRVAQLNFQGIPQTITLSGGISTFPRHAGEIKELIHAADKALYTAKNNGRDQIHIFERMGDQRKQPRKNFQTTGHYTLNEKTNDKNPFITKNISQSGLLIQTISSINLGDQVHILMHLPNKGHLNCVARAVHIHHAHKVDIFEIGLEIVHMDGKDKTILSHLLQED